MNTLLKTALEEAVRESKSPGAVVYVGDLDTTHCHAATGFRQITPARLPAVPDTVYDLASLTKVVATTTAVLLLRDEGLLDLDRPASDYVPVPAFGGFTLRHLLNHTSGLVSGRPYYRECDSIDAMLLRYADLETGWGPGARRRYSDAGFMILGRVVELAAADRLDAFCDERIFKPLGMARTRFNPPADWAEDCAATEQCAWRKKVVRGSVHDENAAAVGGVSGHAGLFSTAADLALFCRALLSGKLLKESTLDEMTHPGQVPFFPWQGLGWLLNPWSESSGGYLPSRRALGHTGWTGTSIWMDRNTGLFVILLANTCHPSREARDTATLRMKFHDAVADAFYMRHRTVHTGIDRILYDSFDSVRESRLALLTHTAATDHLGRPVPEALATGDGIDIRRIFSPEHGYTMQAEAGEKVGAQRGAIPIVSLYGDRDRPAPEELADVDLLVADLQDVGSRYYTYAATLKACIEACAKAGVTVLVLDRPNPAGGHIMEGPIATKTDSPVCWGPVPNRHGLTFGELALFFASQLPAPLTADVRVSTAGGWYRDRFFNECGLPWTPPSPNIPTPEAALAYAGTCLFEGVNVNEGRGTDTPFLLIGAPWLNPRKVINSLHPEDSTGCALEPADYTPESLPGRSTSPRYLGEACKGIRIHVTDPERFRPFRLTVGLLAGMVQHHKRDLKFAPFFDTLMGSDTLRRHLEAGGDAASFVSVLHAEHAAFKAGVRLLYLPSGE
jgi:uncharacterized protein YbbC (DUF1343 family)